MKALTVFLLLASFPLYAEDVTLSWDPNTEPELEGYRIWHGSSPGMYDVTVDVGNVVTATITGIQRPRYFVAQAYDGATLADSGFSNEVFLASAPVPPPSGGLVTAYSFNEGSGTTVADASGNGHTGTLAGAAWSATGQFGGALSFDGTNDWVTVADAVGLDLTTGMTLEAWVNPTALSGWRTVVLKENAGGLAYSLYAHADAPHPATNVNTGGADLSAIGSAALPLNTWTHLAATYDGSMLRLYVNGAEAGSQAVSGNLITSGNPLRIGGNSVWGGEYFSGKIDEIRVYNIALTGSQIQTDMSTPISAIQIPGALVNWQLQP